MSEHGGFSEKGWDLSKSDAYCASLTKSHYENFTVGSWLLPKEMLKHIYSLYSYCRSVDDIGDEDLQESIVDLCSRHHQGDASTNQLHQLEEAEASCRICLLDQWESKLKCCYSGTPQHPVFVSLKRTIDAFNLPIDPFLKLIEANRMDQYTHRYSTYEQLLEYCDHSANPVGRLFLGIFGYRDTELDELSDAICTALQLTNFLQDVSRDYLRDRIYIPREDWIRFGCTENDFGPGPPSKDYREMMRFQASRTMELYRRGSILADKLDGRVKLDVALFSKGGIAVLETIRRQHYDVFTKRPTLGKRRKAALFLNTWLAYKLGLRLQPKGRI